jgi:hypothetical protein
MLENLDYDVTEGDEMDAPQDFDSETVIFDPYV